MSYLFEVLVFSFLGFALGTIGGVSIALIWDELMG